MSLAEIGVIIVKRNEIQRRRQSIRHKLSRAKQHYDNKLLFTQKKKLERASNIANYKLDKISTHLRELNKLVLHDESINALHSMMGNESQAVNLKIMEAQEELGHYKYDKVEKKLPKKYYKAKVGDMRLDVLRLEAQMANVVLELAEFTKETHLNLCRLLKQNNARLSHQQGSNMVRGLWVGDDHLSMDKIEKIVLNHHAENILLKG